MLVSYACSDPLAQIGCSDVRDPSWRRSGSKVRPKQRVDWTAAATQTGARAEGDLRAAA